MMKWMLTIAGVLLLGGVGFIFFMNYNFGNEISVRIAKRKSELGYLAKCVEDKTAVLKRRPSKDEYIVGCLNSAPFLEEHNRVRSLEEADPSYQNPYYDYQTVPFKDNRILAEHSLAPTNGFVILYWNGDSLDRYVSWEPEKFLVQ